MEFKALCKHTQRYNLTCNKKALEYNHTKASYQNMKDENFPGWPWLTWFSGLSADLCTKKSPV